MALGECWGSTCGPRSSGWEPLVHVNELLILSQRCKLTRLEREDNMGGGGEWGREKYCENVFVYSKASHNTKQLLVFNGLALARRMWIEKIRFRIKKWEGSVIEKVCVWERERERQREREMKRMGKIDWILVKEERHKSDKEGYHISYIKWRN